MANAQSGGDVSQHGPGEYLDPLAPLASQFQQLKSVLELVFDDYESFQQKLNNEILSLPPAERFTQSHEVFRRHVQEQFGSTDAFAALIPESDPEKVAAVLNNLFDKLLNDALEGVLFQREPDDHLLLAALFQTLNYSVSRLRNASDQESKNRIVSSMLALLSRLQHTLNESPESLPDEVIRDTAYALHYLTADDDGPDFSNPQEMSFPDVRAEVIAFGAVMSYARLNISISRGAELAGLSDQEFRDKLNRYDVEPRFGPNSLAELNEDSMNE